jgi:hypothetical protein
MDEGGVMAEEIAASEPARCAVCNEWPAILRAFSAKATAEDRGAAGSSIIVDSDFMTVELGARPVVVISLAEDGMPGRALCARGDCVCSIIAKGLDGKD